MIKKVSWVSLTLLALVVLSVMPVLAQGESYMDIERVPIVPSLWNPCAGEEIRLEGYLQFVSHTTVDDNWVIHSQMHVTPQNVVGEGLSTGAEYRFSGVVNIDENFHWLPESDTSAETFTLIDQHRFIAKGVSENTVMQESIHFTIDANGELTVLRHDEKLICQ
jgi:hypothetical protein